jgi:serine/threonine protein kinase
VTSKPTGSAARRLGPYEFIGRLGAGGMGEVYRARDMRLGREVAIKLLPPEVSTDADRLRRFEKEARAASSLNHPNIVTIHEVERIDSTSFIVMELVDGKTLREIVSEGALPVRRLLTIAVQIAEGLARAHSAGIVHRDLKPENVMVTKDGLVKILDFGLAKLAHPELEGGELTQGPTVSGGTSPGVVLGTVGYMSPEQASGHPVDFRSDQFSFGSLLYEMATGKQPFKRATAAQSLAAIIQEEAGPLGKLRPDVPAPLRWIVEQCLSKDPKDRYASTEDLARDIVRVRDHLAEVSGSGEAVVLPERRRPRFVVAGGIAAALLLALIVTVTYLRRAPRPSSPIRTSLLLPEKFVLGNLALSPDGKHLAYTAIYNSGPSPLWIRDLDGTSARTVQVPGDAGFPFWSPDSHSIAFFSEGKLRRVNAAGGAMETICEAERGGGGAWAPDDTILFAPTLTSALYKVSASGGQPVAVTKLDASRHETSHRYPFFLPDGRHFLYMACIPNTEFENPSNAVRVASLDGKTDKALIPTASSAAFVAGRLLYVREGTLLARPFDLGRLEPVGDPVPIAQQMRRGLGFGSFPFGAAESVLVLATYAPQPSTLRWFDRSGKAGAALGESGFFYDPRLSPDGRRVAVAVAVRETSEIWIYEAATGARTKLGSVKGAASATPVWSPEGDRIVFWSGPGEGAGNRLFVRPINGAGEEALLESPDVKMPEDWSADGRFISFNNIAAQGKRDGKLWVLSMAGDRKASPLPTEAVGWQWGSRFSPDGHWIAYQSEESGVREVYVSSFPGPGEKWQVSTAGGFLPNWRRDGRELFYLSPDDKIMAVPVRLDPTFQAGSPTALFSVRPPAGRWAFDVSADGQRFLVNTDVGEEPTPSLTLLVDWTALLKE